MSQTNSDTSSDRPADAGTGRWRVSKANGRWTVTGPTGASLEPFPSQGAAFALAMSMAGIGRLLERVQRSQHPVVDHPGLKPSPTHIPSRRTPLQVIR